MGRWRRTTACERAAHWISLELDTELGELERAALHRHLGRCDACTGAQAEIGGFTRLVRDAPIVAPRAPISVPRDRRAQIVRRGAASLLVAAALSVGGAFLLPQGSPARSPSALGLETPQQRLAFAATESVRAEPQALAATASPPAPFAARVLV